MNNCVMYLQNDAYGKTHKRIAKCIAISKDKKRAIIEDPETNEFYIILQENKQNFPYKFHQVYIIPEDFEIIF